MDKHYKSHFLSVLKSGMLAHAKDFAPFKLPKNIAERETFVGMSLYQREVSAGKVLWLCWQPGEGVERHFTVYLGWSQSNGHLPHPGGHHREFHDLVGPSKDFAAGLLDLEQIEGKNAIWGIQIPTPWDQLKSIPVMAPKRAHDAAVQKAYVEAEALTDDQRRIAVQSTLEDVFLRLKKVLPRFEAQLKAL